MTSHPHLYSPDESSSATDDTVEERRIQKSEISKQESDSNAEHREQSKFLTGSN